MMTIMKMAIFCGKCYVWTLSRQSCERLDSKYIVEICEMSGIAQMIMAA